MLRRLQCYICGLFLSKIRVIILRPYNDFEYSLLSLKILRRDFIMRYFMKKYDYESLIILKSIIKVRLII